MPVTNVSNRVRVSVLPQEATLLTADTAISAAPAAGIEVGHRLENTGNDASTYTFDLVNLAGDDFDVSALELIDDLNGDGIVSAGEPTIPLATPGQIPLAPGAARNLVVRGVVPGGPATGQISRFELRATTDIQAILAVNTDTVTIVAGAILSVAKSASDLTPNPGDTVTFSFTGRNTGSATATAVSIIEDALPASYVLFRDIIPANTEFAGGLSPGIGQALYHRSGDPLDSFTTAPPAPLSVVDEIAVGFPNLAIGAVFSVDFDVRILGAASGNIDNTSVTQYGDGINPGTVNSLSNTVTLVVSGAGTTLDFFTDGTFAATTGLGTVGQPLFLQSGAPSCNVDPLVADTIAITLRATSSGDVETFNALETGLNTGVFRISPNVPTGDALVNPIVPGDGQLEVLANEIVGAELTSCDGSGLVQASIVIDPVGVVFDSASDLPVANAIVRLVDFGGATASVFLADGVTPAANPVTTAADGRFFFPRVAAGSYRIEITPPAGYAFPSAVAPAGLPPGRVIDVAGSYGAVFVIPAFGPVLFDVPLDSTAPGGLFVQKAPSREVVSIGEFVDYTVTIRNNVGTSVPGIELRDRLPDGFAYVAGSARLDGLTIADPAGANGSVVRFTIGTLLASGEVTLVYRLRVGPGTDPGEAVNLARAFGIGESSNVASATVEVEGGVFHAEAFVLGKVFTDCNQSRTQDAGELGVPGVRLFLENGNFVITDGHGKFSFYGLRPRTHVLKVDRATLPPGSQLSPIHGRHGGDGASRFIDLKAGELHRADFAIRDCSAHSLQSIGNRIAAADAQPAELVRALDGSFAADGTRRRSADARQLPASGVQTEIDLGTGRAAGSASLFGLLEEGKDSAAGATTEPGTRRTKRAELPDLEALVPTLDEGLAVLWPENDAVLPIAQARIRVAGRKGVDFHVRVNGREVPQSRVGMRVVSNSSRVHAWEYVGVLLEPGENQIEVRQIDAFGNPRGHASVRVFAPGALARIRLDGPDGPVEVSPNKPTVLVVRVEDSIGLPITARTAVTLDTTLGDFAGRDLDPTELGIQIFVEGGEESLVLDPGSHTGNAIVRATSGKLSTETVVRFVPALRPLLLVGLVEGGLSRSSGDGDSAHDNNRFDEALDNFSDSGTRVGSRTAFYAKGTVLDEYLLTMRYDSSREREDRLFRDIEPERYYPVYGDGALRGFDAQSTSRFYARVDKGASHAKYGDFQTNRGKNTASLAHYRRSLTGLSGHYEAEQYELDYFASYTDASQVTEEIPGRGTSGPYELSNRHLVENSEQVEIVTRDRDQPSVLILSEAQARFTDYEIEPLTGSIVFRSPVPSFDSDLNPVFIRVTYELDGTGPDELVVGTSARYRPFDFLELGASIVDDDSAAKPLHMASGDLKIRLGAHTEFIGELVQTDTDVDGTGGAGRVELRHDSDALDARLFFGETDVAFANPTASLNAGRVELGGDASYRLDDRTRLHLELIRTEDASTNGRRFGAQVFAERSFPHNVVIEAGVRHTDETTAAADVATLGETPRETTSVRLKAKAPVPWLPRLNVFAEAEQDVRDSARRSLGIGGEYPIARDARVYARHEFISSLGGAFALTESDRRNTTLVGIDASYMKNGSLYSEYRARDSFTGRDAEAAIGLRNLWKVRPGLGLSTTFERVDSVDGDNDGESMAIALGIAWTAKPDWKVTSRIEYRDASDDDSWLHTIGMAAKLSESWTGLARHAFSTVDGNEDRTLERAQLGLAYRDDVTNRWDALFQLEYRLEDETAGTSAFVDRRVGIASTHANFQASPDLNVNGRLAFKLASDDSNGFDSDESAQLAMMRANLDFAKGWDGGLMLSALHSDGGDALQYGLGAELGYMVVRNLWISAGYNFYGFEDDDLTDAEYTAPGAYMRFRFKFDEVSLTEETGVLSRLLGLR